MLTMKDILARLDDVHPADTTRTNIINKIHSLRTDVARQLELDEPQKSDFSASNPGLHSLYVNWAMEHLEVINRFMEELDGFSNLNLLDLQSTLRQKRGDLLLHNAAYRDAMIRILAGLGPIEKKKPSNTDTVEMSDFEQSVEPPMGAAPGYDADPAPVDDTDIEDESDGIIRIFILVDPEDDGGIDYAL